MFWLNFEEGPPDIFIYNEFITSMLMDHKFYYTKGIHVK